ncbi:hypothetical protein KI387_033455, partial [Taxus chinensis]
CTSCVTTTALFNLSLSKCYQFKHTPPTLEVDVTTKINQDNSGAKVVVYNRTLSHAQPSMLVVGDDYEVLMEDVKEDVVIVNREESDNGVGKIQLLDEARDSPFQMDQVLMPPLDLEFGVGNLKKQPFVGKNEIFEIQLSIHPYDNLDPNRCDGWI